MVRLRRAASAALVLGLFAQSASLLAADQNMASAPASPTLSTLTFNGSPLASSGSLEARSLPALQVAAPSSSADPAFAQWGRGGRHGRDNSGAAAALFLGAAATIAGTALLVYANRPECSVSERYSGCGYGTKVVGGAVLSAGIVGITIGAITWR